jgi:hypothetical protein
MSRSVLVASWSSGSESDECSCFDRIKRELTLFKIKTAQSQNNLEKSEFKKFDQNESGDSSTFSNLQESFY